MPIDTHHPEYDANLPHWTRNRDSVGGEPAIKAKRETYLPRLSGHKIKVVGDKLVDTYDAYLRRAVFPPFPELTQEGLHGMAFRKPPSRKLPAVIEDYADDIDMAGTTLDQFAQTVFDERAMAAHVGILAEYPHTTGEEVSAAEAARRGWRPYATYWPAERILNWKEGRVNNHVVYTEIRLFETVKVADPEDPWKEKEVEQIRVLRLTAAGEAKDADGNDAGQVYQIVLFQKRKDETGKEEWVEIDRFIPYFRGKPETAIPMVLPRKIHKAPLDAVAQISLHWYLNSASHENGLRFVGEPTAVFIGDFAEEGGAKVTEVSLGSDTGVHLMTGGDAKMLVASGQDFDALERAMANKADLAAKAGARNLESDPKGVEAAKTAEIHSASKNSILAAEVIEESADLEAILAIMTRWAGGEWTKDNYYKINTDYDVKGITPDEALKITENWIRGGISLDEKFYLFKKGEFVPDDETPEKHKADLEAEAEARAEKDAAEAEAALANTAKRVAQGAGVNA